MNPFTVDYTLHGCNNNKRLEGLCIVYVTVKVFMMVKCLQSLVYENLTNGL